MDRIFLEGMKLMWQSVAGGTIVDDGDECMMDTEGG